MSSRSSLPFPVDETRAMLKEKDRERYSRQLLIPGWDQEKLAGAKVVVVGLGGLGSVSTLYLAAAGVGTIRLCDGQKVELSDLNRQVLYSEASLGLSKVEEASRRIAGLNPSVAVEKRPVFADSGNTAGIIAGCGVIVDGLDNLRSRFILNEEAVRQGIPFVHGAVQGWQGCVGVFHPPRTACLACLLRPDLSSQERVPVCGVSPGMIGLIQSGEAIKLLLGMTSSLLGRLLIFDGTRLSFETIQVDKNPECPVCSRV